jgi:hypothetical protein
LLEDICKPSAESFIESMAEEVDVVEKEDTFTYRFDRLVKLPNSYEGYLKKLFTDYGI